MKKLTFKQIRRQFWEELKEFNPQLYKQGKRSKSQNDQVTDIRVYFCDFIERLRRDNEITESQAQRITL
jgi:hypothetical protein